MGGGEQVIENLIRVISNWECSSSEGMGVSNGEWRGELKMGKGGMGISNGERRDEVSNWRME